MIVVSNTSPIISLAAIDRVDLLRDAFATVIVPPAVRDELTAGPGLADDARKRMLAGVQVQKLANRDAALLLEFAPCGRSRRW